MEHRLKYIVSADFGQTTDYTAVAVTRRRLVPVGKKYNATGWRQEGDLSLIHISEPTRPY